MLRLCRRAPFAATLLALPALLLAATPDARPSVGDFGFDTTGMDRQVKPGDDFNAYANGAWARRTTIPADFAYWGVWDELVEKSRRDTQAILEAAARAPAPAGSDAQKIGDYYASFMDEVAIDARGATPLKPQLDAIASIDDYPHLAVAMGAAQRAGDLMPLTVGVDVDPGQPTAYMAYVSQDGLGLPDRDYYLKDDPELLKARMAYRTYMARLLRLAGVASSPADADARAGAVYELEHGLAALQWTRVQLRDPVATYKPWAIGDFATRAPGFDWSAYLTAARLTPANAGTINAATDSAIVATARFVPSQPLPVWRDYLAVRAVDGHARFLAKPFSEAWFAYHQTALAGTPQEPLRWKRGVDLTSRALGEAIGQVYVREHFSPDTKVAAESLVQNLLSAMGRHIDGLDWMSPPTKVEARRKLASFDPKIGYPSKWRDYSAFTVVRGDTYGNALRASRFNYDRDIAKLGQPIDRTEWMMAPMTINAYYNPLKNEIVFPAAVLQPPFFDAHADPAVNYGGIGAIIGHEISHGFDDQGRQFDAAGRLRDWWSPADAQAFKTRASALATQYGAYESLPGLRLNGELTLGENIADNAGLVIAYDAYHQSLGGHPAPVIDGLTGDQRFFLGFAQVWRTLTREAMLRQYQATDPHSPDAIRPRAVRNFDPWYAAFPVTPTDRLFLAPDRRVRIW